MDKKLQIPIIKINIKKKSLRPKFFFRLKSKKKFKPLLNNPSFITFGCWNKNMCKINSYKTNVSLVINKIDELCETTYPKPSFIIVKGDNYYPNIKENELSGHKIKTIKEIELKSGFDCLEYIYQKHKIPIDIIAGNHDLVDTQQYVIETIDRSTTVDKCFITNNELILAQYPIHSFSLCNFRLFGKGNHTLILMIDSNFYNETDIFKMKNCYINLIENTIKNFKNVNTLKEKLTNIQTEFKNIEMNIIKLGKEQASQMIIYLLDDFQNSCINEMLKEINTNKIKNFVLVAHHPLIYYKIKSKSKQDDKMEIMTASEEYLKLCFNIYDIFNKDTQLFYSSADLHLYQEGKINLKFNDNEKNIKQYIAGTGGNDLEKKYVEVSDMTNANVVINDIDISYNMTNTIKSNGFLHWIENVIDKKLDVNFIQV